MANEIIAILEYLMNSPLLIGLAIGSAVFFVIVLVLVICIFVKTFGRMSKFEKQFDNMNNHRKFR